MPKSLRIKYFLHACLLWVMIMLLGAVPEAQATHIRAGDITAKRDTTANPNPRRFFFTMIMYTDRASSAEDPVVLIRNGDGTTQEVERLAVIPIGEPADLVDKEVFRWEYTYGADGSYVVSWNGQNRNNDIKNIAPPSQDINFYIETIVNINALRGFNSTPVLRVAPIDKAAVGRIFVHNPGATDADGDSLAFKLRVPQRVEVPGGRISDVPGYTLPSRTFACTTANGTATSYLTLNVVTGQLEWNAPCMKGEYNVAFVVEEWRITVQPNGRRVAAKLSEVVRDMQIIVKDNPNRPPVLQPKDTCVVAGTTLVGIVRATDPDGDRINLTLAGNGGIVPPASFVANANTTGGVATGTFRWPTVCGDVRERPYQVIFKAEDRPIPAENKLADLQPWNITVVGPPPVLTGIQGGASSVTINWNPYTCQNASVMKVYRREGKSNFVPDACQTGVPASTGYVLIGEVRKNANGTWATSFTDTNNGAGLKPGTEYCYITYAEFPAPAGGKSIASNEVCITVDQDIPYLTNVTVDRTNATNGQITVRWIAPLNLDNLAQPLEYRLYRKVGMEPGGSFGAPIFTSRNIAGATSFVDQNLNTQNNAYRYKLEFYQAQNGQPTNLRHSTEASSVRLTTAAAPNDEEGIVLNWTYNVPWNNAILDHRIYRRAEGSTQFVLVDQVKAGATSGTYTDRGTAQGGPLQRGVTYCYYVETAGTYQIAGVPEPLLNKSQESCALIPLLVCPPVLGINELNCEQFLQNPTEPPYQNILTWVPPTDPDCTTDIDFYTVYFKEPGQTEYTKLATTKETTFTHTGLESFAGCYVVTLTDVTGRESVFSNEVCKDNCFYFMLPNIITPNGDGKNDVFRPDERARFIRSTKFKVFNRWGTLVYESSSDPYINWAGVDKDGNRLTDGVYYYEAEVSVFSIDPARASTKYKGWVEIVR